MISTVTTHAVQCDACGTGPYRTQSSVEDAITYALRCGWQVGDEDLCPPCIEAKEES